MDEGNSFPYDGYELFMEIQISIVNCKYREIRLKRKSREHHGENEYFIVNDSLFYSS